jgi:hypothetical protein
MYIEKLRHLPNDVSLPGISFEEVRGRDNAHWPEDVLVDLKSSRILSLEERPWLPSEGASEMERLGMSKSLRIGSTMGERNLLLAFLELGELLFAMLTTVRDNDVDHWPCCAS